MSITLNSKVYNWAQFDQNGTSRYVESSAGVPNGFSPLTNKVSNSEGTGKSQQVKWRLAVPVIATDDSACGCTGEVLETDYVEVVYTLSKTSTLAIRQDLRLRLASLIANGQYIASVDNLAQATG
jgi:hypothetical protein